MINFQTISFKGLNNTLQNWQNSTQMQTNPMNTLERSPMNDSVSFSGKRHHKPVDEDRVYDLEDLEVVEAEPCDMSDEDMEILEVDNDSYPEVMSLDEEIARRKEEREEYERRRQEQLDMQLNDDLIMYGVVMPELMRASEIEDASIQTLDEAEDVLGDYSDFAQDLDQQDFDAGFDDFGLV